MSTIITIVTYLVMTISVFFVIRIVKKNDGVELIFGGGVLLVALVASGNFLIRFMTILGGMDKTALYHLLFINLFIFVGFIITGYLYLTKQSHDKLCSLFLSGILIFNIFMAMMMIFK